MSPVSTPCCSRSKTDNTSGLEELIRQIRSIDGVDRTETSVVLSTHTEGLWLNLKQDAMVAQLDAKAGPESVRASARQKRSLNMSRHTHHQAHREESNLQARQAGLVRPGV